MRGMIPKDPNACRYCREEKPPFALTATPCEHHLGPDGKPKPYAGHDVYKPSEWVQHVVGRLYLAFDWSSRTMRTWECFGYDPRTGFWMRTTDGGTENVTNVSERAIGASWRLVPRT
jgi:hypothetical protein